jgi:hypothetical protein
MAKITIVLPEDEMQALAQLLKRLTYDDCTKLLSRTSHYPDGRQEADVMWAAVRAVERQFAEAGHAPR